MKELSRKQVKGLKSIKVKKSYYPDAKVQNKVSESSGNFMKNLNENPYEADKKLSDMYKHSAEKK